MARGGRGSHKGGALNDRVERAFFAEVCLHNLQFAWEGLCQGREVGDGGEVAVPYSCSDVVPPVQELLCELRACEASRACVHSVCYHTWPTVWSYS